MRGERSQLIFVILIITITTCECNLSIKKLKNNNEDDTNSGASDLLGGASSGGSCLNSSGELCNHRAHLFSKLFKNYNSKIRPYCGNDDVINATVDIAIRQLMELDEPSQVLRLNAWIRLKWYDCQLVWNATEYGGIDNMAVTFSDIWVPDITLYDSVLQEFPGYRDFRPVLYSNGIVSYNFPTIIESQCFVNVKYFPFDTQICPLVFGSWAHHGFEVDFRPKAYKGDLASAQTNTEWDLVNFATQRNVVRYNCCPEPYPDVTFTLKINRKPLFYLINIMIPTFLISLIGVIVFVLTAESGEKIGTATTVLLSIVVMMLIVSDTLPSSAETVPLIAIYFAFTLCLSGFAGVTAVISINLYHTENVTMSPCTKKFFFGFIAKLIFIDVPKEERKKEIVNNLGERKINKQSEPRLLTINKRETLSRDDIKIPEVMSYNDNEEENTPGDWKLLSNVIDRLCCIIYITVLIVGTVLLLMQYFIR